MERGRTVYMGRPATPSEITYRKGIVLLKTLPLTGGAAAP